MKARCGERNRAALFHARNEDVAAGLPTPRTRVGMFLGRSSGSRTIFERSSEFRTISPHQSFASRDSQ